MTSALTKTMIAVLATSVALGAMPVLAQQAAPAGDAANPPAMMPGGAGPMGPDGMGPGGMGPQDGMGPMSDACDSPMGPMAGGWAKPDLTRFDADGDGKVTLAEIRAKRAEMTKSIDADGDGLLSADELVAAELARMKERVEARVKARIAAQDADGDGKLSAAELASPPMPVRMFERLDANNDGVLSADEIANAPQMMPHRGHGHGGRMGPMGQGPQGMGPAGDQGPGKGCDRADRGGDRGHRGWFNFGN
ncbi:EF-hand domain-containing protein [Rhodobacter lacus]|uniref:EF-hand domain-containing protein n=1 Tax=Rhodobacter lacus TaxID=1641972 RepID=A0ABW5A6W6_9RHOB